MLNDDTRKLFLKIHETAFGFEGITDNREQLKIEMKDVLVERPSIEDIMLGYIGGEDYAL